MPETLRARYEERFDDLAIVRDRLQLEVEATLKDVPHIDRISFRVKDAKSFVAKAEDPGSVPPYADPLVEIEDQVAGRVIVFFRSDLAAVRTRLESLFNPVERSERRPARDAEFGYESDHLVCRIPPHVKPDGWDQRGTLPPTFELQVRTVFMHAYAEPQHDMAYKAAEDLPKDVKRELAWIAASAWGADMAFERVHAWTAAQTAKVGDQAG